MDQRRSSEQLESEQRKAEGKDEYIEATRSTELSDVLGYLMGPRKLLISRTVRIIGHKGPLVKVAAAFLTKLIHC